MWKNLRVWLILPIFSLIALVTVLELGDQRLLSWYFAGLLAGIPLGLIKRRLILENKEDLVRFLNTPYLARIYDEELRKIGFRVNGMAFLILLAAMVYPPHSVVALSAGMGVIGIFGYKAFKEISGI